MRAFRFLVVIGLALGAGAEAHAIIGRPLTPVSFAGAARRTVRRTAYAAPVAGAAVVGAATVGAAAAGAAAAGAAASYYSAPPPGCAPGVPCGGVVYQPYYSGGAVVYVPR